ncbi:MAG: hypothetical protein U0792_19680 [Gemmataceae bacterium]
MMEGTQLVTAWQGIINGPENSWVLFENGTCVVLMEPVGDLSVPAIELLRENGPVFAGSSFGDFSTIELDEGRGWVVTCHHNDILTFVAPDEVTPETASDLLVGLFGRSKRGQDAEKLKVIHVEDRRPKL